MPTRLKRYYGAQDLHFITCSCHHRLPVLGAARSRLLSQDPGRNPATLSVRGVWIRDHARAFPSLDQPAGEGRSVGGDESLEKEVRAQAAPGATALHGADGRFTPWTHMMPTQFSSRSRRAHHKRAHGRRSPGTPKTMAERLARSL